MKKVEYEVTLKKHTLINKDDREEIITEIKKQAAIRYYGDSDNYDVKVISVEDV
jgi:hypothetical protein